MGNVLMVPPQRSYPISHFGPLEDVYGQLSYEKINCR